MLDGHIMWAVGSEDVRQSQVGSATVAVISYLFTFLRTQYCTVHRWLLLWIQASSRGIPEYFVIIRRL